MVRYTAREKEIRSAFAAAKRGLRDAEMYQTPKKGGSHVAVVDSIDNVSWNISAYSTHPTYHPPQEHVLNTVIDIINDAGEGMFDCVQISSTDIEVHVAGGYDFSYLEN